jgi:hypothetical protein
MAVSCTSYGPHTFTPTADTSQVGDLVFGELSFLARKDDAASEPIAPEPKKKKRKKDFVHTKEGEISAFFALAAPGLAEKDGNIQTNTHQYDLDTNRGASRHEQEHSSKADAPVPTVEIPDKNPYLGFGSRGRQHESSSYATWSESVRAPSRMSRHSPLKEVARQDQHDLTKYPVDCTAVSERDVVFKRPAPPSMNKQRTNMTVEHFAVSSVAPSLQRVSRSLSYPQHTSSPRRVNLVAHAVKFQSTESVASPSSMPPYLPTRSSERNCPCGPAISSKETRSDMISLHGTYSASVYRQATLDDNEQDRDTRERSSSDFGKVLQQCNDTFQVSRQAAAPRRRHTDLHKPSSASKAMERERTPSRNHHEPQCRPTVRFSGVEMISLRLPNFSGPSIYEQQAQRQQVPLPPPYEEDEIYEELYPGAQEYVGEEIDMMHHHWQLKEFINDPGVYRVGLGAAAYGVEEPFTSDGVVEHLQSDNSVVAPGFWRPNRLY